MNAKTLKIDLVRRDIELAKRVFGSGNVWWPQSYEWIKITNYMLPKKFNKPLSNLLIIVPPLYGLNKNIPLEEFYLDMGLKIRMNAGFRSIGHYHDSSVGKYAGKKWAWFCLHANRGWSNKDTILQFLKMIDIYLENA